jgi:hypothetical protein
MAPKFFKKVWTPGAGQNSVTKSFLRNCESLVPSIVPFRHHILKRTPRNSAITFNENTDYPATVR